MAYGGESNAKKLARASFWFGWSKKWRYLRKWDDDGRVLVLSGPDAADVRALRALGVRPSQVTAVDIEPKHLEGSRASVPEADYVLGDVFEYVKAETKRQGAPVFDLIFLDFCQVISYELLVKCLRAARQGLKQDGILAIGAMYGRETGQVTRRMRKDAEKYGFCSSAAYKRIRYLWMQVEDIVAGSTIMTMPVALMSYRSGRRVAGKSLGVPMIYMAFNVHRMKRFQGKYGWQMAFDRYQEEFDKHGDIVMIDHIGDDPDGVRLREAVVDARKTRDGWTSKGVADCFNVSPQTVAAWLAWDTMRSSKEKEAS